MKLEAARQAVTQNLVDAGCDQGQIDRFWRLYTSGQPEELYALLAAHRRRLLECCHAQQRKIDCLDYLVYQLEHGGQRGESTWK